MRNRMTFLGMMLAAVGLIFWVGTFAFAQCCFLDEATPVIVEFSGEHDAIWQLKAMDPLLIWWLW